MPNWGQRHALPLRRGLNDLRVDRVDAVVVLDPDDTGYGTVAVEHVVDSGAGVDDERHLNHLQSELAAQAVLDEALDGADRLLRLTRREERVVVTRKHRLELLVGADPGPARSARLGTGDVRHDLRLSSARSQAMRRPARNQLHPNRA